MKFIPISELGQIITGHTPPTHRSEYYGDVYRLIMPTDMVLGERYVPSTAEGVSTEWATIKAKALIPKHSTCVVTIGTIGKICLTSESCFTNQAVNAIIPDTTRFDPFYIFYLLRTIVPKVKHLSSGTASGRENVSKSAFSSIEVPVCPLHCQHKIAAILSAYDDLIENNTRRIAILEAMAQAIYREWFVEFRFPGHEKVKLVDSPLGKIPAGWKHQPLVSIADVNAQSIKKGQEPDEVNYVDIASVSTGKIDEVRLLPFAEAPGRARRIVRHGDIIWSTVRPNRKSYSLILNPLQDMIASTGFAVISGTKAPYTYLYHALTTDDFVGYLVNHATGSAYPAVNSGDFEKAQILVPSEDVMEEYNKITNEMFLLKHQLQVKNRNLRTTRDLLLPKLISGQLEVEDLDIETGETVTMTE